MTRRTPRRWFRYSLSTLLVLVTVFCIWLGWQANIVHKRKAAIAELTSVKSARWGFRPEKSKPQLPFWRRWMGDHLVRGFYFDDLDALKLGTAKVDEIQSLFPEAGIDIAVPLEEYVRLYGPLNSEGGPSKLAIPYPDWRAEHPDP
jgi:hypothetical protein